jgi:hypothetical protein
MADAKKKKALTRIASGFPAKNLRTASAGAYGFTTNAPCLSKSPAMRLAAKRNVYVKAGSRSGGPA